MIAMLICVPYNMHYAGESSQALIIGILVGIIATVLLAICALAVVIFV